MKVVEEPVAGITDGVGLRQSAAIGSAGLEELPAPLQDG